MSDAPADRRDQSLLDDRLRVIFDTSQAGMFLVSPSGTITFANARMAEMFGSTLDELVGTSYPSHVHADQRDLGDERMQLLIAGGTDFVSSDRHYIRKDGSEFWGHLNGRRHEAPDGSLISLVGIITDISELKATQASLQMSEAKFRTLLDSSMDVIFVLDRTGTFQFVSPVWELHFGFPAAVVVGQDFRPFIHPEDAAACGAYLQEVLSTGKVGMSPPYRVRHADGSWRLFLANGRSFQDSEGNWHYVGVGRDITAQHQLELEREQLIIDLRTALDDVKTLKGILPICASCKRIRDDQGYWSQVEKYIAQRTHAEFTHGLCPECISTLYPDYGKGPRGQ